MLTVYYLKYPKSKFGTVKCPADLHIQTEEAANLGFSKPTRRIHTDIHMWHICLFARWWL